MDKLTATRYFLKVADTGSFSKTAKLLGLPVSTVSRRIKDLEQNLGAELFRRSTRFLSLTDIGKSYYNQIEDAVRSFDRAEEVVSQTSGTPSGIIKISALPSYADLHIYPALERFRKIYPEIIIDLYTTDVVHDMMRERIDFAIRPTSSPPQHLIAKVLDQHKMGLVASPEYLETHGKIQDFAVVKNHKALCYSHTNGIMPWYAYLGKERYDIEKTPYFICSDTTKILEIAINGEGVALLPEWTYKESLQKGLVKIANIGWDISFVKDTTHRLYLLYDKKTSELKRNKVFLKFFMDHIKQSGARHG